MASVGCDGGYLLQFDHNAQRLFPVASEGISPEIVQKFEESGVKPDAVLGKSLDKRQPFCVAYEEWRSPLKKRLCGEIPLQSVMLISLHTKNGVWGLLVLFHRTQSFSQKDMKSLEFIGEKIGFLHDTMSLWNHLSKKMERAGIVRQMEQSVIRGGAVVMACLLNNMKAALRASNCYLLLLNEKKNLLYGAAAADDAPEGILDVEISLVEIGMIPLSVKQKHYMVVENALSDNSVGRKWGDHFRSRSLLSVPLIVEERTIGALIVDETAYFRSFTQEEIELVVELAPSAAISIEMAIKYQEALQRQERQERLSVAIFQAEEQDRRLAADALRNETSLLLDTIRRQIKEAWTACPAGEGLSLEQVEVRKQLDEASVNLEKVSGSLARLSSDLYPSQLETQGLIPMIRTVVESFSNASGVIVHITAPASIKGISQRLEMQIFRIFQEALQNIGKHANAKAATLSIEKKETSLLFSMTDQGKGFDAKKYFTQPQNKRKGMGLINMKGRVELLGGTFFVESEQERGTRISIKVPLTAKN